MSSGSSSDLLSISVLSEVDGKRYKILVKEANFNKLKVEDIKKNLQNITGLSPSDQDISINGAVLSDSWTAVDFGLHPFCQLTLTSKFHKNNNKATPSLSPRSHLTEAIKPTDKRTDNRSDTPPRNRSPSPHHPPSYPPPHPPSYSQEYTNHDTINGNGLDERPNSRSYIGTDLISKQEHERLLAEMELSWKHRLNNETRKFLEEKKGILKKANQDREHLLNENLKLRAMLGDSDLLAFNSKTHPSYDPFPLQEKLRLEEQLKIFQSQFRRIEQEKEELAGRLSEEKEFSANQQVKLDEEKRILLSSFVDEKNKILSAFRQEKEEWVEKFRERFSQLPGIGNASPNLGNEAIQKLVFGAENAEWDTEKAQILKNWSEETDVLTMIYETEKQKWQAEREEMLREFEDQKNTWLDQDSFAASLAAGKVQQIQQMLKTSKEKEEQLQTRLAQVRRVADERALIAQAAQRSLEELKEEITTIGGTDSASISQALVSATSQKNIEIQKVDRLLTENENLSTRVKEEIMLRTLLSDKLDDILGRVRIVCRCRPLLSSEAANQTNPSLVAGETVIECKDNQVVIKSGLVSLAPSQIFDFSCVLGPTENQKEAYDEVLSFVQSFCDGQNVLVANFGHTGSGKSYTLFGGTDPTSTGIVPRAVEQIFAILKNTSPILPQFALPHAMHTLPPSYEWFLDCSVIEIHLDEIFDLLSPTPSKSILNFRFSKCTKMPFKSQSEIQRVLSAIGKNRQVPGTSLSPRASQSHLMVVLQLRPESIEYDQFNAPHPIHMGGDVPALYVEEK